MAAQKAEQARLAKRDRRPERRGADQARCEGGKELAAEEKRITQLRGGGDRAELAYQRRRLPPNVLLMEQPIVQRPVVLSVRRLLEAPLCTGAGKSAAELKATATMLELSLTMMKMDEPGDGFADGDRTPAYLRGAGALLLRLINVRDGRNGRAFGWDRMRPLDRNYYSARYDAAPHFYEDGCWSCAVRCSWKTGAAMSWSTRSARSARTDRRGTSGSCAGALAGADFPKRCGLALAGWARLARSGLCLVGRVCESRTAWRSRVFPDELPGLVGRRGEPGLAVGLRRSYGDNAPRHPKGRVIDMSGLDRLIAFDRETGIGTSFEAGISLLAAAARARACVPSCRRRRGRGS